MDKIQTFKKFRSGEYLSHLQKIQFFRRFDCGHLLNISHICKDSDIQKIPLPENTILSLGQNLNIIFPLHATSLHPTFSASLQDTLCHFTSPPILSASLRDTFRYFCLTSRHFTSPILFAFLHATSLRLLFFMHHFTSLCATSLRILALSMPHFTPLRVASHFSHSLHLISRHFTSPPLFSTFTSLHFASPPVFFSLASPHFTPLHFTSHFFRLTSLHFMPLHFASFYLPHFMPLHATSRHLQFFLPHFMPFHSNSLHLPSFRLTSPHLTSPHLIHPPASLRWQSFTKKVRKRPNPANTPASQPALRKIRIGESFEYLSHLQKIRTFKRFESNFSPNLSNVLNILLTSLFLQKIQIFERFNFGESLK